MKKPHVKRVRKYLLGCVNLKGQCDLWPVKVELTDAEAKSHLISRWLSKKCIAAGHVDSLMIFSSRSPCWSGLEVVFNWANVEVTEISDKDRKKIFKKIDIFV
jgi:hypothetical protein